MFQIALNESTAAYRRIPVVLVSSSDNSTPATGITFSSGEIKVSKAGATEANHAGTVVELAGGQYYYEFSSGEVDTRGFVSVRFAKTGIRTFYGIAAVVPDIAAKIDTVDDFLDTEIAAIKAKTDNLPSDPADASDIAAAFTTVNTKLDTIDDFVDTEVAAIKAKTALIPASPATEGTLSTIAGYIDTEVAAIKAKTDLIPASPATEGTLTTISGYIDTEVAAIKAKTDLIPASPASVSDIPTATAIRTEIDSNSTKLDVAVSTRLADGDYTAPDSASTIASAVWASGTRTLSSFGSLVSDIWNNATRTLSAFGFSVTASSVTDKTGYSLAVTPPTAVQIRSEMDSNSTKLANLDTTVSSRLPTSSYTAPPTPPTVAQIRQEIDSNSTKLDVAVSSRLPTASYVAPSTPPTAEEVAEAILTLDLSTVNGEASRSLLNAVRFLRNKWTLSGTTLTVFKEDDLTSAWTATVTTNEAANPVTGTDPA